ncbi:MAG: tetratricopeptide repeat protein [Woeseia sp.]
MPLKTLRGRTRGIVWILILWLGSNAAAVSAQQPDTLQIAANAANRRLLSEAEQLLGRSLSGRAYDLLSPHEARLAGNPLYDYFLGVAALDTGRIGEAIFALRRALSVEPGFSGARMELARAYYEAGNNGLARPLFVGLLDENPPPAVRDVLSRYIEAIDARPAAPQSRFMSFAELFAGYDNNANGSTSNQQFLGFTLNPENVETESPFAELGTGFDWFVPRSTQFAWRLNARISHRDNTDASFVNATTASGLGGLVWQRGNYFGHLSIGGYWGARDGESNENYAGVDTLLGVRLNGNWDVTAGIRAGAQRYDANIEILDVDRLLYTLGVTRRFESGGRLTLEGVGGGDSEKRIGSPYGNSKTGGRLSLSAPISNSIFFYCSVGSLTSDYDGLFFGALREDEQLTSILQVEFRDALADGLSIIPRLRYVDNESEVPLYEYDRTEIGIVFKWAPR